MERRFDCTSCGKCCYGKLPLTLADAIKNAGRFPLAMLWTTVRKGAKSFELTARLGATVTLGNRKQIAVQITPVAYIPPSISCPALGSDGLCSIHADKPLRCRSMPFYPYREEWDQVDMLIPRGGWDCDISATASVVYQDRELVGRKDFDNERRALVKQAPTLRAYADRLLAVAPNVKAGVEEAAMKRRGGHVVLNFTAILSSIEQIDLASFAQQQLPVLTDFADRTDGKSELAEFNQYYRDGIKGLELFLGRY